MHLPHLNISKLLHGNLSPFLYHLSVYYFAVMCFFQEYHNAIYVLCHICPFFFPMVVLHRLLLK